MEEQAVLQMLSFGLEIEQYLVDRVNVTIACARRQRLLKASFDKSTWELSSLEKRVVGG
jgi:hypothetical protein